MIPNRLAERYASREMTAIWSSEAKIRRERELWVAVLEAQRSLGVPIPLNAADAYRAVLDDIDLASIRKRELRTRHDLAARLEEFCALAGCEYVHLGLTSRDLTENVEQVQIRDSLRLLLHKSVAALSLLARRAEDFLPVVYAGRTHNVPAQAASMGRFFAVIGEELFWAVRRLEELLEAYPLRGLKGPVGTQKELLDLLDGDEAKVDALDAALAESLGFKARMEAVGQVYPRSLDFSVAAAVFELVAAPGSFATTLRLMAGAETVTEGFAEGQVGSSSMPHKMNARSCERICALIEVMRGHLSMVAGIAGRQWYEGDVSCSATRRVLFPDLFLSADGVYETLLATAGGMRVLEQSAAAELRRCLPAMSSSALLAAAVADGASRSEAYALVQSHSQAASEAARNGTDYDFARELGTEESFPLSVEEIRSAIQRAAVPGRASTQVKRFTRRIDELLVKYPQASEIKAGAVI